MTAVKNYEQEKNTATAGKLIKAAYVSYGYVYTVKRTPYIPETWTDGK